MKLNEILAKLIFLSFGVGIVISLLTMGSTNWVIALVSTGCIFSASLFLGLNNARPQDIYSFPTEDIMDEVFGWLSFPFSGKDTSFGQRLFGIAIWLLTILCTYAVFKTYKTVVYDAIPASPLYYRVISTFIWFIGTTALSYTFGHMIGKKTTNTTAVSQ